MNGDAWSAWMKHHCKISIAWKGYRCIIAKGVYIRNQGVCINLNQARPASSSLHLLPTASLKDCQHPMPSPTSPIPPSSSSPSSPSFLQSVPPPPSSASYPLSCSSLPADQDTDSDVQTMKLGDGSRTTILVLVMQRQVCLGLVMLRWASCLCCCLRSKATSKASLSRRMARERARVGLCMDSVAEASGESE